ncbi:MAG: PDZ domain-containing protein [Planctomycetota bacterium]
MSQAPRAGILGVFLGALLGVHAPASGDADTRPISLGDDRYLTFVERLSVDDFEIREQATQVLSERLRCNDAELFEWIDSQRELSPEQRARLLRVARSRFDATPRGALGFGFGGFNPSVEGVIVGRVEEGRGFPAVDAGLIRPNDVIVSVNGLPIPRQSYNQFVGAAIKSHPAGATMPAIIARPVDDPERGPDDDQLFTVIETNLPLGSWESLGQQPIPQRTLEEAWAHRIAVLGSGDREQRVIELASDLSGLVGRRPRANRDPLIHPAGAYTDFGWFKKRRGSPVSSNRSVRPVRLDSLAKQADEAPAERPTIEIDEPNPDQVLRNLERLLESSERAAEDRTQTATQRRLAEDRADRVRERIRSLRESTP